MPILPMQSVFFSSETSYMDGALILAYQQASNSEFLCLTIESSRQADAVDGWRRRARCSR